MAETNEQVEQFENEGGAPAPSDQSGGGGTQSPAPAAPTGVSAEEFRALQQRYGQMEQWIAENFFVDDPEPQQQGGPDPMQLIDQRVAPLETFARSYAQDQGDKKFNEIMDELEKDPAIGKIHNRKIAFHFAEQAFDEVGGNASKAVQLGAQRAAAYEKELREAGRAELKQSLKRPAPGGDEFGPSGGEPGKKDWKSYDEVRDAWAAQSEL